MYFCIKSSIGTQDEVGWLKKCFKPPVIYSTDRSKAMVPVLVLLFVALWFVNFILFYEAISFKFCLVLFFSCILSVL